MNVLQSVAAIRKYITAMNVNTGHEKCHEDSKLRYAADAALDDIEGLLHRALRDEAKRTLVGVATGERGGES